METIPKILCHLGDYDLETFLRGMETSDVMYYNDEEIPLKPSLEGWKLVQGIPLGEDDTGLETFLRGMETLCTLQCST